MMRVHTVVPPMGPHHIFNTSYSVQLREEQEEGGWDEGFSEGKWDKIWLVQKKSNKKRFSNKIMMSEEDKGKHGDSPRKAYKIRMNLYSDENLSSSCYLYFHVCQSLLHFSWEQFGDNIDILLCIIFLKDTVVLCFTLASKLYWQIWISPQQFVMCALK